MLPLNTGNVAVLFSYVSVAVPTCFVAEWSMRNTPGYVRELGDGWAPGSFRFIKSRAVQKRNLAFAPAA
jgi:hypothetical protein